MTETETTLWLRVCDFQLDDGGSQFTFSDRLAAENQWTASFTRNAVCEYKRFMFLTAIATAPLSPAPVVDQVWHLHLLYTRSYWEVFCGQVLGKIIHHMPTRGGRVEKEKFGVLYSNTLKFYSEKFGEQPPKEIWPSAEGSRTNPVFTKVDKRKNWIVRKPIFFGAWNM